VRRGGNVFVSTASTVLHGTRPRAAIGTVNDDGRATKVDEATPRDLIA
jgi:hypothetical protein